MNIETLSNEFEADRIIRPDKSWSLEKLEEYAVERVLEINGFGRKTISQTWLFGESLSMIRALKKANRSWMDWVKTQPYSLTSAANAIKVFERVGFEELQSFDGLTLTDLKSALDIIQAPVPKRRSSASTQTSRKQRADQSTKSSLKLANHVTDSDSQEEAYPTEQVEDGTSESATETIDRKVSTKPVRRNSSAPEVGPKLTASEVLGRAYSLLLAAEADITPDCSDLLNDIAAKVAAMLESLKAVSA